MGPTTLELLLGQKGPHATEQSKGQSRATAQADATQGANKSQELVTQANRERHDKPNVHAVMVPMAQPIGGLARDQHDRMLTISTMSYGEKQRIG